MDNNTTQAAPTITFGQFETARTVEVFRVSLNLIRNERTGTWSSFLAIGYLDAGRSAWIRLDSAPQSHRKDAMADLMANVATYFEGLPARYTFTLNGKRRDGIPSYLSN